MKPSRLSTVAGLLVAVGAVLSALPATLPAAGAAPADAYVRAAHFSPDTPGVDVYLTSFAGNTTTLWLSNVTYGSVSPYDRLAAGVYAVAMRPHGASPSSPPVLTWTLNAQPGAAYTAAGEGTNAQLHAVVIPDDLSQPAPGQARVRVVDAASRAPSLSVTAQGGPTVASDITFTTTTPYSLVPGGTWTLQASGAGTSGQPLTAQTTLKVDPGTVQTLVALDAKSGPGIELTALTDAAGSASAPNGALATGGGGMAAMPWYSGWQTATPLLGLAALLAAAGTFWMRRRRTSFGAGD